MATVDLASKIESLAECVMMSDPHDLPAVKKLIDLLDEITGKAGGEGVEVIEALIGKGKELAEEMIVQQGEEAENSLRLLGQVISAIQTATRNGPGAALELVTDELGLELNVANEMPANVDDKILSEFLSRQKSVLEELEGYILALEKKGLGSKEASELKRLLHTLKGETSMLGLDNIQQVCHETETYLEKKPDEKLVDTLLEVKDWLSLAFENATDRTHAPSETEDILNLLRVEEPAAASVKEPDEPIAAGSPSSPEAERRIAFDPAGSDESLLRDFISEAKGHLDEADVQLLTIESDSEDREALNAIFRSFHTIKGGAGFLELSDISELSHISEDLLDKARKGSLKLSGASIDAIFETVDTLRRFIDEVERAMASGEALISDPILPRMLSRLRDVTEGRVDELPCPAVKADQKLGEILVEKGKVKSEAVDQALNESSGKTKLGEMLVKKGNVSAREVADVLRAQKNARVPEQIKVNETVKIDTERLDKLLDAIGELVIAESMVSQDDEILKNADNRVTRNLGHLHKISRVVQELGMSMRMVPIRPTFQKMARLVRDLSKKAGKNVDFSTHGEETELDRSVVEKIGDPLIHLVRNAVDHGIENNPADRVAAGKPECASVELRAFHQGGNIFIEISDDGRGLDREAILAKAIEKGLVQDGSEMADREIYNLIFTPGFSTAKKVTDVSGRGVGMDVVRKNIESLRGNIELTSEKGKGTKVSMRLPLTLAIIDGMIIKVGTERFIVPTLSVVESLRPLAKDLSTVSGRAEMLSVRGALMPFFRIASLFNFPESKIDPTETLAMIVEAHGKRVALQVDSLLGQQQVVIKTLGEGLGKVKGISGGAIMADGRVGLILDIPELVSLATTQKAPETVALKNQCTQEKETMKAALEASAVH